ncbi:MAG TPA: GntR family transcriptional regulator [Firmicutes bacterium]|nr:GntR family transcriptional regulator [Bacillota bacterium]
MVHPGIDRAKPVPLYHQLKESLRERIEAGEWSPGSQIPTEKELAAEYGVSQITVRQALARLVTEGLVERCQGRGTFVSQPSLVQDILDLGGFSAGFASAGVGIETRLLGAGIVPASEGVAKHLKLNQGSPVIEVRRLRLTGNGVPISLQTSYMPSDLCRPVLERDLARESLFTLLTDVCGLELARAEEVLSAVAVDEYEAKILLVAPGSPAFLVRRTTFDKNGTPVEFVKSVLRGDRCKFTATLTPRANGRASGMRVETGMSASPAERGEQTIGIKTQVS